MLWYIINRLLWDVVGLYVNSLMVNYLLINCFVVKYLQINRLVTQLINRTA